MARWLTEGSAIAGLLAGPIAWGANFQLSYALAPRNCGSSTPLVWAIAVVALAVSIAGGVVSWRAWRRSPKLEGIDSPSMAAPRRALSGISIAFSAFFGLLIVIQAIASLFLNGCLR